MNAEIEDWGENRLGVLLALDSDEIERLIVNLRVLRKDSNQHFHISADGPGETRLGDIEVSVRSPSQPHNMRMTSMALSPGTEISDEPSRRSRPKGNSVRSRLMWAFWAVAIVAELGAVYSAIVTVATKDYRPILIGGVWASAIALVALHSVTLAARGWKRRLPGIVAALWVFYVLSEILRRLSALAR
jgi:hypothetical protein